VGALVTSGSPYWTTGKAKGRCLAVLPGAGRCYRKPGHHQEHRAGTKVQFEEFELRKPVPKVECSISI